MEMANGQPAASPRDGAGPGATRIFFLLAGIALFVYLTIRLGPLQILSMLGRVGWGAVAIIAIFTVHQTFRAWALAASVPGGREVTFADAFSIRLSGEAVEFLTFSGPFLAEPA